MVTMNTIPKTAGKAAGALGGRLTRGLIAVGCILLAGGCAAPVQLPAESGAPTVEVVQLPMTTSVQLVAPTTVPTIAPIATSNATPSSTPTVALTIAPTATPTAPPTVTPTVTPTEAALLLPTVTPAPTAAAAQLPAAPYRFSPLYDNLAAAYPASFTTDRFVLHYTPDTLPAQQPEAIADLITAALAHHEQLLGVTLAGSFELYAAGSLFAAPDQALRGRSFSANRRTFFLYDGTGTAADQAYIAAHELTHLFTWNTLGAPSSVMLSEGVAVYAGMHFAAAAVPGQGLLPLQDFCAAYWQAGVLPRVAQNLDYLGHIRNLENYYSAGCFVQYLIEHYGAPAFGQLYPLGDYAAVYGKSLAELEAEWVSWLAQQPISLAYPASDLVAAVASVEEAYADLFAVFDGSLAQLDAFRALDRASMALLMGHLDEVQSFFGQ
jgi:hypothetical protein